MKSVFANFKCVCLMAMLTIFFLPGHLLADYTVTSPYLINPDLNIKALLVEADFWKQAKDEVNGGFYTYLDAAGKPVMPLDWWWGSTMCEVTFDYYLRQVVGQSRIAYGFTRAFMVTGDETYLNWAREALDYLYRAGKDRQYGGWHFSLNQYGTPAPWLPCDWWDPNDFKWSYHQIYPLLGITTYYEATRSSQEWNQLMEGYGYLQKLWDNTPGMEGYYKQAEIDWNKPEIKDFTGIVDTITTHTLPLYLMTEDKAHKERMFQLVDNLQNHLVASMDDADTLIGFAEEFDSQWNKLYDPTEHFIGHILKSAWVLARAYILKPNESYRDSAKKLMYEVWEKGMYDHENGAPFTYFDWKSGVIKEEKLHWVVEQGVTGGLMNYYISDNPKDRDVYLEMADESLNFYMEHFIDFEKGGSYISTDNQGNPTAGGYKGDLWKTAYHGTELSYYTYLYGNLYLKEGEAALYYYFEPSTEERIIPMNPIPYGNRLRIKSVEHNGEPYGRFSNGNSRQLMLAPGKGGKFKVVYEVVPLEN